MQTSFRVIKIFKILFIIAQKDLKNSGICVNINYQGV